jgi:hypothetical protein
MEGPKFFCSYSREDSEFVLKLAKELRKAGASLWLDRLDILGGQRWDEAVQAALESCPGMLAVLSPSAVASPNFMDEVSFALEERKQIIPVLYRECAIPFRLRRVQYVDFATSYESGFADLLRALLLEPPGEKSAPIAMGSIQHDEKVPHKEAIATGEEINAKNEKLKEAPSGLALDVAVGPPMYSAHRRALTNRWVSALSAAVVGYIIGAIAFLLLATSPTDRRLWFVGALFVGVPGVIVGAITGTNRRVIIIALVGALAGMVIGYLSHTELLGAIIVGMPFGAIVGAVAGVILKRIKGWE